MHQLHWEAIERVKKRTDEPAIDTIIDVAEIIRAHDKIIRRYGGEKGILNRGELEFAAGWIKSNPKRSAIWKAAILMRGIVCGHPFVDGNKRTGFVTLWLFLLLNDIILKPTSMDYKLHTQKIVQWAENISNKKDNIPEIIKWLNENCE